MTIEPKLMSADDLEFERVLCRTDPPDYSRKRLLAHIAAQNARIAKLEADRDLGNRLLSEAGPEHARLRQRIAELELRLEIATGLNVGDRQKIMELEAELARATNRYER